MRYYKKKYYAKCMNLYYKETYMDSLNISKSSEELRKLIMENPDLPIAVLVGEDVCDTGFYWTYVPDISCHIGEYLDCEDYEKFSEYVITDRDDFEERLQDIMADQDEYKDMSDDDFENAVKTELAKYDQYWKKAIFIYADV
jgi:hypothetical protein